MNPNPAHKSPVPEPPKHVIAQYTHRTETVICVCGWNGSSAAPERGTSPWTAHIVEMRGGKKR